MVVGMDLFREKFAEYPDCYTIIGGAACDILMTESIVEFLNTINDEKLNLAQIGLPFGMEEGIGLIKDLYLI